KRGLLYCGTERGVHVSFDDGGSWHRLETNPSLRSGQCLPVTPIWDLVVHGTDLVVATHGRSFWILDDITPLHQLQDAIADKAVHLFAPRETLRFRLYGRSFDPKSKDHINYRMTGPVTVAYKLIEKPDGRKGEQFYDAG